MKKLMKTFLKDFLQNNGKGFGEAICSSSLGFCHMALKVLYFP